MKKTDLENLYRANRHKFSENPSKETWQRLEYRLDEHFGHKRRRRLNLQRPATMAAALLVLIVMAGIIIMVVGKTGLIQRHLPQASVAFEEIKSDNTEGLKEVMEFTRRHHKRLAKPIAEGDENKKLRILK